LKNKNNKQKKQEFIGYFTTLSQWHTHTRVDHGCKFQLNLLVKTTASPASSHERQVISVQLIWKKKNQ